MAAGTDAGAIVLWDFETGTHERFKPNTHSGSTDHICFGTVGGQAVIVTGGSDGKVGIWTHMLDPLDYIDVGASITALEWVTPAQLAVGSSSGVVMIRFT